MSRIEQRFIERNPKSQQLAAQARTVAPGGVSQLSRDFAPFMPYYARGEGTRKWTVDGHEIVDFCMGHGSLLYGHNHPTIAAAIADQLGRGSHFVGPTEPELALAQLICELVPSAERARFVGTGSEACELALRIARAATGKDVILKFEGHYHGWHDHELAATRPPYDKPLTAGVPRNIAANRVVLPPGDLEAVAQTLAARSDIACIIVEPAGGTHGLVPTTVEWIRGLRELTAKHGVVLIFDEMVTGFRLAPGGYQAMTGITPDLTTLGKAMFGGLPGAAIAGRADLMDLMKAGATPFVGHYGTWNAWGVGCAAGVATVNLLKDGKTAAHINAYGARVRERFNAVIAKTGVHARVYGAGSHVHFMLRPWPFATDELPRGRHAELAQDPKAMRLLRLAWFNEGFDFDFANNISALHGDAELELAAAGFERVLGALVEDGVLERG